MPLSESHAHHPAREKLGMAFASQFLHPTRRLSSWDASNPHSSPRQTMPRLLPQTLPGGVSLIPEPGRLRRAAPPLAAAPPCPYMKMNTLSALLDVCSALRTQRVAQLARHEPVPYTERWRGAAVASLGCETILHMRDFRREERAVGERLVSDVLARKRRAQGVPLG